VEPTWVIDFNENGDDLARKKEEEKKEKGKRKKGSLLTM
jgi:hypothetical protein